MNRLLAIFILLILSPIFFVLSVLVFFFIGSPILFTQKRPGLKGEIFSMYKFRSMSNTRDNQGQLLPDEQRLGRFGQLLRKTSLDELPGLFNVALGQMNFVGPRPLLVQYLPLYSAQQNRRHEVKPGMTGWAQVNGRNAIDWDKKFELDVWYVDNQSFWLDVKILLLTVKKVLFRQDINQDNQATMTVFLGNKEGNNG